jgi:arylsulfatase A-like enzyme
VQSRRSFLKQSIAFLGLGATALRVRAQERANPNFLFIFADDHCYEAIHALGCDEIHTPNLDRLVQSGTTFTNAYNMGSWTGAVCVASRTMLITGMSVWHANRADGKKDADALALPKLQEQRMLWPQLLADAGYKTYMTGKWHVKAPSAEIFGEARDERPGMPKDSPEGYHRPESPEDYAREDAWKPWKTEFGGFWEGGKHWSEVVGDNTVDFLKNASEKDNPFFIYAAFNAPHDPRQAPKEYVDMYPLDKIRVPENFLAEYPYDEEMGCNPKSLRDEKLAPFPRTEYAIKVNRQEYYAIITHMDAQIGRILDALDASGKADNTYVFFTADHGLAVGRHGLIGKQNMYDHSLRVPLMVKGPDVPADKRLGGDVYLQDVMATTLDLAGIEKPDTVFFNSLMPMLRGERAQNYDAVYGAYTKLQRAIRKDGFKLIAYPEAKTVRLYDMRRDPFEMNDLAGNPEYAEVRRQLFSDLMALQSDMEDELDLTESFSDVQ